MSFEDWSKAVSELIMLIPYFFGQKHPEVDREFFNGHFVSAGQKSPREFSALAIDQAQGQNNAIIKGDGGAIGFT